MVEREVEREPEPAELPLLFESVAPWLRPEVAERDEEGLVLVAVAVLDPADDEADLLLELTVPWLRPELVEREEEDLLLDVDDFEPADAVVDLFFEDDVPLELPVEEAALLFDEFDERVLRPLEPLRPELESIVMSFDFEEPFRDEDADFCERELLPVEPLRPDLESIVISFEFGVVVLDDEALDLLEREFEDPVEFLDVFCFVVVAIL